MRAGEWISKNIFLIIVSICGNNLSLQTMSLQSLFTLSNLSKEICKNIKTQNYLCPIILQITFASLLSNPLSQTLPFSPLRVISILPLISNEPPTSSILVAAEKRKNHNSKEICEKWCMHLNIGYGNFQFFISVQVA